jgi:Synaptobrevin.
MAKTGIQEALQKVSERGEKIKGLDVKIREMTEKSKKFAEMAAELAKQQKKKWWEL